MLPRRGEYCAVLLRNSLIHLHCQTLIFAYGYGNGGIYISYCFSDVKVLSSLRYPQGTTR